MSPLSEANLARLQKVDALIEALIAHATNDPGDTSRYGEVRRELLADPMVRSHLPDFVRRYRSLEQFWPFIKAKFSTYAERRVFILDAFGDLVSRIEASSDAPADELTSQQIGTLDELHVQQLWGRALERRESDPEGAITVSRTLLESVCKQILDHHEISCPEAVSLPKLYSKTAEALSLAPSQHTEKVFKQILGGCQSVVEGLGSVRNRLSDAHGKGKAPVRPATRHAQLAVNLAGAMATFLIATHKARELDSDSPGAT